MKLWNPNLHPPGGFFFVDADGLKHEGGNLDELISRLTAYRVRRGLPLGNPLGEVHQALCKRSPRGCRKANPVPQEVHRVSAAQSLMTRVSQWLRGVWVSLAKKQQSYVTPEEAKRRVKICKTCSLHTPFFSDCAACQESLHTLSYQLRAGRDRHTSKLKVCKQFGTDLRVDALLNQPHLPDAPEHCWKRG